MWLHLTPMRPCLDVTTWEASLWCWLLRAYLSLLHSVWWYAYHACLYHPLAFYTSLHTCLHVHTWLLLASVSSMLQHNEVMEIRSKPTFVPRRHSLLCVFLACWLAFLLLSHACLFALRLCAFIYTFSFHCLSAGFLVSAFACTHMKWGCMELGHDLLGARKKVKDASMWSSQVIAVSRFRSLASPIWLCTLSNPFPSSFLSLLDGLY